MSNIIIPPNWQIPEQGATPESVYRSRRSFIRKLSVGIAGTVLFGCNTDDTRASLDRTDDASGAPPYLDLFPATRNPAFTVDRPLTDESLVTSYNNFYEFSEQKAAVQHLVDDFETVPWDLEVTGMVDRPMKLTVDELLRQVDLEERLYRFRCVEAWAMTVPWTGFPLSKLLSLAGPQNDARYVRFLSFYRPSQAPNQKKATWYDWPYYEALTMEEAMNELTFATVGLYGEPLPKQNGAPMRIIVPWKYGYKGPKSVVKIELVRERPHTFWNDLQPAEYSFTSNVNPNIPHPRWSQAEEQLLGQDGKVPTRMYNGYGEQVAHLYE